jgi:hypothetical protein
MTRPYSIELQQIQAIVDQANALERWLSEHVPYVETSQKHLDPGTLEQAYWHYGYVCALRDVLAAVNRESAE